MTAESSDRPSWNALLSRAIRILRRARMLKVADMADAMQMKLRTYEHFEAGGGQISLERIRQLAAVANADPHAFYGAIMIGSPAFAYRAADNKLMTAFLIGLQEFDLKAGDDIRRLDTMTLMTAFSDTFG